MVYLVYVLFTLKIMTTDERIQKVLIQEAFEIVIIVEIWFILSIMIGIYSIN